MSESKRSALAELYVERLEAAVTKYCVTALRLEEGANFETVLGSLSEAEFTSELGLQMEKGITMTRGLLGNKALKIGNSPEVKAKIEEMISKVYEAVPGLKEWSEYNKSNELGGFMSMFNATVNQVQNDTIGAQALNVTASVKTLGVNVTIGSQALKAVNKTGETEVNSLVGNSTDGAVNGLVIPFFNLSTAPANLSNILTPDNQKGSINITMNSMNIIGGGAPLDISGQKTAGNSQKLNSPTETSVITKLLDKYSSEQIARYEKGAAVDTCTNSWLNNTPTKNKVCDSVSKEIFMLCHNDYLANNQSMTISGCHAEYHGDGSVI